MGKPNPDSGPLLLEKQKELQRTVAVEAQQRVQAAASRQIQQNAALRQQQDAAVQQTQPISADYDQLYRRLTPLPSAPPPNGQAPRASRVSWKEKKRQRQAYQALGRQQRLMNEADVRALPQFRTREGTERWANEQLPHSTLTRADTLRQVLERQDYSNFENLDGAMRNIVANRALHQFMERYQVREDSDPEAVCAQIKQTGPGVSALLDPPLRLALSLAQRDDGYSPAMKRFFQALDEAMSTAVMTETLTKNAQSANLVGSFQNDANPEAAANRAVRANRAQQIQIAKRLLLMQLSDFQKITNNAAGQPVSTPWDKSMAVALSHCSRVVLTLPRQQEGLNDRVHQKAMWQSIFTVNGENEAQDNSRASSTHSIVRREVNQGGSGSKEKKVPFNFIGQRGMNCAIGGLGNAGISGKTICNDGSCGHFYSMYKEADETHFGAMLMGLESDAAGVTNQMGHTHDIHATAEKASSLGGQRTDEVGNKYGGRQCDLSHLTAHEITLWMDALETAMLTWQAGVGGMRCDSAQEAMSLLSGKKLDAAGFARLSHLLGGGAAR